MISLHTSYKISGVVLCRQVQHASFLIFIIIYLFGFFLIKKYIQFGEGTKVIKPIGAKTQDSPLIISFRCVSDKMLKS